MKLFYFHVFACGEFYADPEGCTCSGLDAALLHAIHLIQMVVDCAPSAYPWRTWSIIVAGSDGALALTVPFAAHVEEAPPLARPPVVRRNFPQVITYGDAAAFGPAANEQSAAMKRPPGRPGSNSSASVARAALQARAMPVSGRRPWLSHLLNRFNPRWLTGPRARGVPIEPRAAAR